MKTITITDKVNELLNSGTYDKKTLAEELDISRPTLDARLSGKSLWKRLETGWIKLKYNEYKRNTG